MADDRDDEVRRLRAEVHRLREDNADLQERLAYAWRHVEEVRARLLDGKRPLQAAEPVDREQEEPGTLVPVTAAEIDGALVRLRHVKPLPVA
jgi:hypothetical protein